VASPASSDSVLFHSVITTLYYLCRYFYKQNNQVYIFMYSVTRVCMIPLNLFYNTLVFVIRLFGNILFVYFSIRTHHVIQGWWKQNLRCVHIVIVCSILCEWGKLIKIELMYDLFLILYNQCARFYANILKEHFISVNYCASLM